MASGAGNDVPHADNLGVKATGRSEPPGDSAYNGASADQERQANDPYYFQPGVRAKLRAATRAALRRG